MRTLLNTLKQVCHPLTLLLLVVILIAPQRAAGYIRGYVNITFQTGTNLFGNPLDANTPDEEVPNDLLHLLPSVPEGTTVSLWDTSLNKYAQTSRFQGGMWTLNLALPPGTGALLTTPRTFTNTFSGAVLDATGEYGSPGYYPSPPPFGGPSGLYLWSCKLVSPLPFRTGSSDVPANTTLSVFNQVVGRNPQNGEQFWRWDTTSQAFKITIFTNGVWDPEEPALMVGEAAFFVISPALARPFAATQPAMPVTDKNAVLGGMVGPNGLPTSAWLEWGTSGAFGNKTSPQEVGDGTAVVRVSASIGGLSPGAIYHYRLVASNATAVTYGAENLLITGGKVAAWGANNVGQTNCPPGLNGVVTISGGGAHSVVLRTNGEVVAWGDNSFNQTNVPADITNAVAILCGQTHTLALIPDGRIRGWGYNESGSLDIPATLTNVLMVGGGGHHHLALKMAGTVEAWGRNDRGQTDVPPGLSNVVAVTGGAYHSLALKADGSLVAWGGGSDWGVTTNLPPDLTNVVAIASSYAHSLALKADGTVRAWGYNSDGQTNVPHNLSNVVAIATAYYHCMALTADGTLVAWGSGADGRTNQPPGLTHLAGIAGGDSHSLAVGNNQLPPDVLTRHVTQRTSSRARLNGQVTPNGAEMLTWFEWGETAAYGNTAGTTNVGGGSSAVAVTADVMGLTEGVSYHFRLVATNSLGAAFGKDSSFVAGPPGTNTGLNSLTVSFGPFSPAFDPAVTNYVASMSNSVTGASITATCADTNATMQVRLNAGPFAPLDSGVASAFLPLNVGTNSIDVQVTAEDGVTTQTYSIGVTRLPARPTITTQPTSQTTSVGASVLFSVLAAGTEPLSYQWYKESALILDATNSAFGFQPEALTDAGNYVVVVTNSYGSVTSAVAVLTVLTPAVPDSFNPAANSAVYSLALQTDGKILVGGGFTTLGNLSRNYIGRLNADGTVDAGFNPGATGGVVFSLAVQADGKILVGGNFTTLVGQSRNYIGRLNADGTLDSSFNPGAGGGYVESLAVQPDGKILVGGIFTTLAGQTRNYIGRLNADGTLDTSFNPGANNIVFSLALQPDGKILVGGYLTTLGGQSRNYIGRLNGDGTLDASFNPGANYYVLSMALQADGNILAGGAFTTLGGQSRTDIGRLNLDGTLDTSFNPGADNYVASLAVQADGKIVVGGIFTTLGGESRANIGRLNADGTLDASFNPGADSDVYSLAVQADGKILVGGGFTTLGGQSRNCIGRLNNTAPATQSLSFDGSTLTWVRGSSSPEVWRTTFEYSPDGYSWTNLGGIRTPGGWQLTGLALPTNTTFRARGYIVGGEYDGSGWFVETIIGPLAIAAQPASLTNNPETTAAFSVSAVGAGPLTYEWLKDSAGVTDGGNISGAATANLTLSNVLGADAGGYSVVISNLAGSVTSVVATLTVIDPLISVQPTNATNNAGTARAFSVSASGTAPLSYQWLKNGAGVTDGGNISGAATARMTLNNVLRADAAGYSVVISNAAGSVTSAVATLTVIDPAINTGPASQAKYPGDSITLSVAAGGTPPLSYQWRKDGLVLAAGMQSSLVLTNLQGSDAGRYDVVVSNVWGSVTSRVAFLSVNLAFPDSFNPEANGFVGPMALQADGKILVGGSFSTLGGQSRNYIGRLNADGTQDTSFNSGANSYVYSLAVQADRKILVGGSFTTLGGLFSSRIGRLNADGTLDTSFNSGANYDVYSLALQGDGKILVGGIFTTLTGQTRNHIGRLNADGTLDTGFNPGANNTVFSLALQPDGKILVGGYFTILGGQSRNYIGRLNGDGTLDASFHPGANYEVYSLALEADGKILVGGNFTTLGGQTRSKIGRLNADGTLDATFNPGASGDVNSLAVQADGKVLAGGQFTTLGGQNRMAIGRLNADGTLDATFNPGASSYVYSLAVQADGGILVGGSFSTLGGQTRKNIGRLSNTAPATQNLMFDGSMLTWMRGGTSPEVWRTTFEYSPEGNSWATLAGGIRIPGGWQMTGLALPGNTAFRARGYTVGGEGNGSAWFVETVLRPPLVISDILYSTAGQFGFSASGPAGQVVVIEASPDLETWTPLETNTLGSGPIPFIDPQTALLPSRFYRVRSGP